jgi:hypothetical protein
MREQAPPAVATGGDATARMRDDIAETAAFAETETSFNDRDRATRWICGTDCVS